MEQQTNAQLERGNRDGTSIEKCLGGSAVAI